MYTEMPTIETMAFQRVASVIKNVKLNMTKTKKGIRDGCLFHVSQSCSIKNEKGICSLQQGPASLSQFWG
jgi:hypothetical protein